jgi:hypothetical protein
MTYFKSRADLEFGHPCTDVPLQYPFGRQENDLDANPFPAMLLLPYSPSCFLNIYMRSIQLYINHSIHVRNTKASVGWGTADDKISHTKVTKQFTLPSLINNTTLNHHNTHQLNKADEYQQFVLQQVVTK